MLTGMVEYWFSMTGIFPYKNIVYDSERICILAYFTDSKFEESIGFVYFF